MASFAHKYKCGKCGEVFDIYIHTSDKILPGTHLLNTPRYCDKCNYLNYIDIRKVIKNY